MTVTGNDSQPWWQKGLPFACTRSGRCCHQRGEVAYVYVNYRERQRLAAHLGLEVADFNRQYTRSEDDGARTLLFRQGHCIFLQERMCQVHEAKPVQCRTWPFWPELLHSEDAYQSQVREFCPGSRPRPGTPVVDAAEIARQMEQTEQALWEV